MNDTDASVAQRPLVNCATRDSHHEVQEEGRRNVWLLDLRQQTLAAVTSDGVSGGGVWAKDGSEFLGDRVNGAARDIFAQRMDGSGAARLLLQTGEQMWPAALSSDQRTMVVMKPGESTGPDLWTFDVSGSQPLRPLVQTPGAQYGGKISPDGKWVSYFSNSSGVNELFVTPFPNGGRRWQVSPDGGREALKDRATFEWDPPRAMFSDRFLTFGGPGNVHYDVAPDGRFLMIEEVAHGSPTINVVQGWSSLPE